MKGENENEEGDVEVTYTALTNAVETVSGNDRYNDLFYTDCITHPAHVGGS